jgi:hypothetical protein
MRHVRKGCLTRSTNEISSDGSRIEGSHKGWNAIQRSFACGIEVFVALAHDFVLRRNIRIGYLQEKPTRFVSSTYGSHHLHLVSHVAALWNDLIKNEKKVVKGLSPLPVLQKVVSQEGFGLVRSRQMETFGGLIEIKDDDEADLESHLPLCDDIDIDEVLQGLGVDPALQFLPLVTTPDSTANRGNATGDSAAIVSARPRVQVSRTYSLRNQPCLDSVLAIDRPSKLVGGWRLRFIDGVC